MVCRFTFFIDFAARSTCGLGTFAIFWVVPYRVCYVALLRLVGCRTVEGRLKVRCYSGQVARYNCAPQVPLSFYWCH